jgi:hypothetical protein
MFPHSLLLSSNVFSNVSRGKKYRDSSSRSYCGDGLTSSGSILPLKIQAIRIPLQAPKR